MRSPASKRTAKKSAAKIARSATKDADLAADSHVPTVILVSGGTGYTSHNLLAAAMAQFAGREVNVIERFGVRTARKAKAVVNEAAKLGAVLMHTLVDPRTRLAIDQQARQRGIPYVDMLGPTLSALGDQLAITPRGQAGLLYELHREQFDRLDAVDFALAHDDGLRMHELDQADVVLVGPSRASKSVTCVYLAMRGVCAANVPLIPGHPVPNELIKLDPDRVIGLMLNAAHLASLRRTRMNEMSHLGIANYADPASITAELLEIRKLITRQGWTCIDVSYKATEELTEQIIKMIPARKMPT